MAVSRMKKFVLIFICILLVLPLIIVPYVVNSREQGDKMVAGFQKYTREIFRKEYVELCPQKIDREFQNIRYGKPLSFIQIVTEKWIAKPIRGSAEEEVIKPPAIVTSLQSNRFGFIKTYNLLISPNLGYNFPFFFLKVTNIGSRRIFILEIIAPASIPANYLTEGYEKMKKQKEEAEKVISLVPLKTPWIKEIISDLSIHTKTNSSKEEFLLDLFDSYLSIYLQMIKKAPFVNNEEVNKRVQEGIKNFKEAMEVKGGFELKMLKYILGPEKQKEFVRKVMFGLED